MSALSPLNTARLQDRRPSWIVSRSSAGVLSTTDRLGPYAMAGASLSTDHLVYLDASTFPLWHRQIVCRIETGSDGLLKADLLQHRDWEWSQLGTYRLPAGATSQFETWKGAAPARVLAELSGSTDLVPWLKVVRSCRARQVLAGGRPVAELAIEHWWRSGHLNHFHDIDQGRPLRVLRAKWLAGADNFHQERICALAADLKGIDCGLEVPAAALAMLAVFGSAPPARAWRLVASPAFSRRLYGPQVGRCVEWAEKLLIAADLDPGGLRAIRAAAALSREVDEPVPGPGPDQLQVLAILAGWFGQGLDPLLSALAGASAGDLAVAFRAAQALAQSKPDQSPAPTCRAWVGLLLSRPWSGGWLSPRSSSRAPKIPQQGPGSSAMPTRLDAFLVRRQQLGEAYSTLNAAAFRDPEAVHDFRVAVRRLRTALRLLSTPSCDRASRALAKAAKCLGPLRDADVLLDKVVELSAALPLSTRANLVAVVNLLVHRHRKARKHARRKLKSSMLLRLTALLDQVAAEVDQGSADRHLDNATLERLATESLTAAGSVEANATPEALHALRLAVKHWRYALELLAPEPGAGADTKQLVKLQTLLGDLNDLAVLRDICDRAVLTHGCAELTTIVAKEIGALKTQLPDRLKALRAPGFGRLAAGKSSGTQDAG